MSTHPAVVSVHALDAGGGEGLVADAHVFAELDCRALSVATSLLPSEPLSPGMLRGQLEAVGRDTAIAAVRIGFVKGQGQVELLGAFIGSAAPETSVISLFALDDETRASMIRDVVPKARVVVTRASGGDLEDLRSMAKELRDSGARAVVVAGLVVRGRVIDLLDDAGVVVVLDTARIQATRVPGLAGAHAAALAAHLARGLTLPQAAEAAQRYVGFRLRRGR